MIARIESGSVDPRLSTFRRVVEALEETEGERMEVERIMHEPVISVSPEDSVPRAVELMREKGFSQLPVLDGGVPVGSISEADVVHEMNVEGREVSEMCVGDLMGEGFPTISGSTDVETASRILESEDALLVVEKGEVIGVVTSADVMRILE